MGSITTGVGLISGIDTASLIDQLIALESRGKLRLQDRVSSLQAQQTALLDINSRLLNLKNSASSFRLDKVFQGALAASSNEDAVTASATTSAQPGSYNFIVKQLVSTSQQLTKGFGDADTTPLGLDQLSFEFGKGSLALDRNLADLNAGAGVSRGKIDITDKDGTAVTIDLTDVTTVNEVIDRINDTEGIDVIASVSGDHFVITDTTGLGSLVVADTTGYTTATELGIAGSTVGIVLVGSDINTVSGSSALASLNDGNGVLVRDGVSDLKITARDGTALEIDFGRVNLDIDDSTLLADLNSGDGVRFDDDPDTADIKFIARDGTEYEVDLTGLTTVGGLRSRVTADTGGHIAITVTDGNKLTVTDTISGAGNLKVLGAENTGTDAAEDLGILNETGVAADSFGGTVIPNTISDPPAATLQDVIDRINGHVDNGGKIVAAIGADNVSLSLTDTTGGGLNLIVEATGGNPYAAAALGIETDPLGVASSTIDGTRFIAELNTVMTSNLNGGSGITVAVAGAPQPLNGATLLSELFNGAGVSSNGDPFDHDFDIRDRDGNRHDIEVDDLTTAQDLIDRVATVSGGNITLSIEGDAFRVTDNTGQSANLRIRDRNGANVASELGLVINAPVDTVLGVDTSPIYSSDKAEVVITNRAGTDTTVSLTADGSLQNIIDGINAAGAGVTASLNRAGNGLAIVDTTGGTGDLTVSGVSAASLGIATTISDDRIEGTNLQHRYVSEATRLEDLNYGRDIGNGSFRVTDGLGQSAVVSIGGDETTLYDVILEINSKGLAVLARVNDNGDGLVIEEDPAALGGQTPFVAIKVEASGGTTAKDLNILGEAADISASIDGSYERVVDLDVSDNINEVVTKINDADVPVSATVLNAGGGPTPYRISFSSGISGTAGELIVDGGAVDLGVTSVQTGRDAKVFFGSDPASAFLVTSGSNTLDDVVTGLTINLHEASDDPVTVTVSRDTASIVSAVSDFVTAFNDSIGRINQYDFFDVDTEERGVLLGNPVTARVATALYRTANARAQDVETQYQFLRNVGIRIGNDGEMTFDEDAFLEAFENDPDAVENLFAAYKATTGSTETVVEGVTITNTDPVVTRRGIGELFDALLDDLTNSIDGSLKLADESFQSQIELTNERIEAFDERLERRREQLQAEFSAMELALSRLQSQGNALSAIAGNLALARGTNGQ